MFSFVQERLLEQVKEMQMKCEKGLKSVKDEALLCAGSSQNGRYMQQAISLI